MRMSSWRKWLFILIVVTLVVMTIVFWGSVIGAVCVYTLIQSFMVFLFNRYARNELARLFQQDGKHVQGWR